MRPEKYWMMLGLLKAKKPKREVARILGVALSTVYANAKRRPSMSPEEAHGRTVRKVLKHRSVVRAYINKFVVRMEEIGPRLNRSGAVRKNSKKGGYKPDNL